MRRSPREEGQRWLDQAKEDLRWTRLLSNKGAYHLACFLSQQVAEKALKGFLFAQGEEIVLGHSVQRLSAAASEYHKSFSEKSHKWSLLDGYYIPTRYPNALPDGIPSDVFTSEASENAVELAAEAVEWVESLLASDG